MLTTDFDFFIDERGIYYEVTEKAFINPRQHENLVDILYTIDHEALHHCITKCKPKIDEREEETVIRKIAWIDDYITI